MPDYTEGKIYKILNSIYGGIHVGPTIKTLSQRMTQHRLAVMRGESCNIYKRMHELGAGHFYIEPIEHYSCNDVYGLRAREGHFIRQFGTLNKQLAGQFNKYMTLLNNISTTIT